MPPGGVDVDFLEPLAVLGLRALPQDLDLLVGREDDDVRKAILVGVMERDGGRVTLERLGQGLHERLLVGPHEDDLAQRPRVRLGILAPAFLPLGDDGDDGLILAEAARRHREGLARKAQRAGERHAPGLLHLRKPHLLLVGAQHEQLRRAIAIPVDAGDVGDAAEGGIGAGRGQGAIGLLAMDQELAPLGIGHEQVGPPVAVDVRPGNAAAGLVRAGKGQHGKGAIQQRAGRGLALLAADVAHGGAPGLGGDGDELGAAVAVEVLGRVGADGREGKVRLRAELSLRVLEPKAERVGMIPVHQQEVLAPVAVDVVHLHGLDGARVGNLDGVGEGVVGALAEEVDVLLGEQKEVGQPVSVEVAGREGIGVEEPVAKVHAARERPGIGALVELDHQLLGLAEVGKVGTGIAVEVGDDQRRDALLGGDAVDAEAGVRRELVHVTASDGGLGGVAGLARRVGEPRLVVEEGDLGPRVVHHDQVVASVAVEVGRPQEVDASIHGEDLGPQEPEARLGALRRGRGDERRDGHGHGRGQ